MFRIGEFSIINRVTVKTLRHYDEIGLLKPAHVDNMTNYRMYTTEQLPRIQKIIALKQIGLSLTDIGILLRDDSDIQTVIQRLIQKQKEMHALVEKESSQLQQLTAYITVLEKEKGMEYHITIKDLPEVIVASTRKVIKDYNELFSFVPAMGEAMKKHGVTCAVPEYCFNIYHDGEYKASDIDVEVCEAVVKAGPNSDGVTYKTIPGVPMAACVYHKGPYETLGKTYGALIKWIDDNGYKINDLMRESYINGIWNNDNPEEWLTEIQAPVVKK